MNYKFRRHLRVRVSDKGQAFIKQKLRSHEAVYGGEITARHYFCDFAYCDSCMIPWLLIFELMSCSGRSLGDWVKDRFLVSQDPVK